MRTLTLPQVGKAATSGTVRRWMKQPGEAIQKGELLLEVETEEGLVQAEAGAAGKLSRILVPEGKTVAVGGEIAVIDEGSVQEGSGFGVQGSVNARQEAGGVKQQASAGGAVVPILMPQAGQSMEEGTIVKWHVKAGDRIKKGQVIFEVETDKATLEVEAADEGRVARIVVAEGGTIAVKRPVAFLAESDGEVEAFVAAGGEALVAAAPESAQRHEGTEARRHEGEAAAAPAVVDQGGRVKASPAARKIAGERGINLASVGAGSGPGGRILSTDVEAKAGVGSGQLAVGSGVGGRRKMSKMRRAIAANLSLSKQTIPHFYVRLTVDASPMFSFYREQKARFQCSVNDVVTAACAKAIREFPQFRGRIDKDEIVELPGVNIGIAVGIEDGLTVPVLLNADRMSLQDLAASTRRIVENARAGKLEGVGQGVFTITNLGMFGVEEFAAIVNPPEAAILAVGAARESVVVKDGAMRAGRVMTMTLSCDHRIIDGLLAAKFMARLKEIIESPATQLA